MVFWLVLLLNKHGHSVFLAMVKIFIYQSNKVLLGFKNAIHDFIPSYPCLAENFCAINTIIITKEGKTNYFQVIKEILCTKPWSIS